MHNTIVEKDEEELRRLIGRCRRLASEMTDDATREALHRLAEEYEAQLPRRRDSFMLGTASPRD